LREVEFVSTIKHPKKLIYLDLRNNLFSSSKLEVFALFYQLEELYLGTTDLYRIFFNSYNNFYGSLKPLEDLKKLKKLCVSNTEINRGLEYLPDSLEKFFFADTREVKTGEDLGLTEIMKELGLYKNNVRELKKGRKLKEEKINKLEEELSIFQFLSDT
jgi:Leucine-rich repeat (LRR) protein